MGGMEKIFGGNIEAYAQLCEQARKEAYWKMIDHANSYKADAIIAFRYDATEFSRRNRSARLWHGCHISPRLTHQIHLNQAV